MLSVVKQTLKILLCSILTVFSNRVLSQSCLPQGIEFTTQSQIDSFPINFPGCNDIEGDLKIRGAGITKLFELIGIERIRGNLIIDLCPALLNLQGLDSIKHVGRDVYVSDCYNLITLNGLSGLTSVKGTLYIVGSHSLINLNGLEAITVIDSGLVIWYNNNLINLSGLDSLKFIAGELFIAQNSSLTSLNGLNSLVCIKNGIRISMNNNLINLHGLNSLNNTEGIFQIDFNSSLSSLDGLNSLKDIGLYLSIYKNNSLKSLAGLSSLSKIGGWLEIKDNPQLIGLSGLDNIDHNSIAGLTIIKNSSLSTCHVKSTCDYLAAPGGTISIYGNAPGCSTREEVEAACAGGMQTDIRIFLQGAYAGGGVMNTNLNSFLPCLQPYDTIPRNYIGTETLSIVPAAMADWVLVELRDSADYNLVSDTRAGALFSDGTVKDTNLVTGLCFYNIDTGYYYVAIHHRNHISVMTEQPVYFPLQSQIDFTDTNSVKPVGGTAQAQIELEPGKWGMICGDINNDGILKYSGPGNDRMAIIQRITGVTGSTNITKTISGYYNEDLDLNTHVKYSGPSNDGAIIIQNIITLTGSTSITATYSCPVLFLYP